MRDHLNSAASLVQNGRRQRVSKLEAFIVSTVQDAINGVPSARRELFKYLKDNPGAVKPRRVLRLIDKSMSTQEAANAYGATLAHLNEFGDLDDVDFIKGPFGDEIDE